MLVVYAKVIYKVQTNNALIVAYDTVIYKIQTNNALTTVYATVIFKIRIHVLPSGNVYKLL